VGGMGRAARRALAQIEAVVEAYDAVRVVVSDIQWPLNNALYARLVRRRGAEAAALDNFPDGIGNLQIVYPNRWQWVKDRAKQLLGKLGGVPYAAYAGDWMGLEASDRIYSLLPTALPTLAARIAQIPLIGREHDREGTAAVLFVGQCYEQFVPAATYRAIVSSAAEFTAALGYPVRLYKPHPLERGGVASGIFEQHGFTIIDDPRPVEEIFLAQHFDCLVSYNSSALAHVKLFFGDAVRCIAVHSWDVIRHTNVEPGANEKMNTVFDLCGVEQYA
jgi:hypothetical protein